MLIWKLYEILLCTFYIRGGWILQRLHIWAKLTHLLTDLIAKSRSFWLQSPHFFCYAWPAVWSTIENSLSLYYLSINIHSNSPSKHLINLVTKKNNNKNISLVTKKMKKKVENAVLSRASSLSAHRKEHRCTLYLTISIGNRNV